MTDIAAIRDGFAAAVVVDDVNVVAYPKPGMTPPVLMLDAGDEGDGYYRPGATFDIDDGQVDNLTFVAQLVVPIRGDLPTTLRQVDGYITAVCTAIATDGTLDGTVSSTDVVRVSRPQPVVEITDEGSSPTGVSVSFTLAVHVL